MARGENFVIYGRSWKREIEGGVIMYADRESVLLVTPTYRVRFHRYFTPRGFYGKSWEPFIKTVRRKKTLTVRMVFELANKYDIENYIEGGINEK